MRQQTLQRGNSFPLTAYFTLFALANHLPCTKRSKVLLFPSVLTDSNIETSELHAVYSSSWYVVTQTVEPYFIPFLRFILRGREIQYPYSRREYV